MQQAYLFVFLFLSEIHLRPLGCGLSRMYAQIVYSMF